MKKSILTLTISALITGAILTSCSSPEQKVENAENNVIEAKTDLNEANDEYLADVEKYKKETEEKIAANDKSIAEFNARKENQKKEVRDEYNKKIAELERKNSDMEKKMADYKVDGKENWEKFKAEFSRDMDELGKAFKDLTVNNVK